jgi:hypothetical protein
MAQPRIQKFTVSSGQALEEAMVSYLAKGFVVANKTSVSLTMQKKREFKVVWAVIGFLLCFIPLVVYLIIYATQPEVEIVELVVAPGF